MRSLMIAAACAALMGLTACDAAKTEAPAAPAAPKSMARMVQMYQGQEQVAKIDTAEIKVGASGLAMTARGDVDMPGFKNAGFLPRINAAPPKDGIYEVDVVADRPTAGAPAATPIEVKGAWEGYPVDRLKGVKFFSKTNSLVVMLPAA